MRLSPLAVDIGLASSERAAHYEDVKTRLDDARVALKSKTLTPQEAGKHDIALNMDGVRRSGYDLLSYATIELPDLLRVWPELEQFDGDSLDRLAIEAHYAVYMDRQKADIESVRRDENLLIPAGIEFNSIAGLSNELRNKLNDRQPKSIAEAQRIEGMTPAGIALIIAQIRKQQKSAA
jgi:tRNA uridine 5-carboxymethylaminomethyl modification enzyme